MRNFVFEHITGQTSCTQSGTGATGKRQVMDRITGMWAAIAGAAGIVCKATVIASVVLVGLGAARPAHALEGSSPGYGYLPGGVCIARAQMLSPGASVSFGSIYDGYVEAGGRGFCRSGGCPADCVRVFGILPFPARPRGGR